MRTTLLGIVLFSAGLGVLPCSGQTFGQITGVVTDASGAVVVGATVTVTNPETNLTRSGTTNSAGNYTFPSLLPGIYNIKADMQGFQAESRNGDLPCTGVLCDEITNAELLQGGARAILLCAGI